METAGHQTARVRARFLGNGLNLRTFEGGKPLALHPLTIEVGERGVAVLFRFGAVALVNLSPSEEARFLESLAPAVVERVPGPEEEEEVEIDVDPATEAERVDEAGRLKLRSLDLQRLRVAAHIVAKSAVLAWYEQQTRELFDRIEALVKELRRGGSGRRGRELAREIGDLLLTQARTVGRAEVTEKPELTWDDPELDRLYERLALEYELRERDRVLSRKLDIASRTVETYLDLIQTRQGLRVEWYIVVLIVVEIALFVYEMSR